MTTQALSYLNEEQEQEEKEKHRQEKFISNSSACIIRRVDSQQYQCR
jgi:hypothetical protein